MSAMRWPVSYDLAEPGRSIVAGAIAVIEGLVAAGADQATVRMAVKSAWDVYSTVSDARDPQNAISEFIRLEALMMMPAAGRGE